MAERQWDVLASGFQLAEAPRADGRGGVWFTDVLGGGVHRWCEADGVETVVPKRRGVGGIALHVDGGVVVSGRDVTHVTADNISRVLFAPGEGVTGFNDLTATPAGTIVAGGLRFMPFAGESPVPGSFWHIERAGKAVEVVTDIDWPNGVGLSPDGSALYVCDYSRGEVVASTPEPWSPQRVLCRTPNGEADGLAVDEDGGIWVALGRRGSVARFTPDGDLDLELPVPAAFVTSLTFGGADLRTLFVTTAAMDGQPGALLRTTSPRAGTPLPLATI